MKTIKGPAIFLAQFAGDSRRSTRWTRSAAGRRRWATRACRSRPGTAGCSIWSRRPSSKDYCDVVKGTVERHGLEITELSTHLQGQLRGGPSGLRRGLRRLRRARRCAATRRRARNGRCSRCCGRAKASRHLGLDASVTFSGALAYPYLYPWPPRPKGLIDTAFDELAKRWRPILDAYDEQGVDVCYEIHPGEDLLDGASFERFLGKVDNHPRCCINYDPSHFVLQALDYLQFIDFYHERIKAFHVKDAELNPTGRQGVYSRLRGLGRPGRPLPLAGRRRGRFRRHLQQAHRLRLRLLGGARVGVLPQEPRGRRARGGRVHRGAHHPGDRAELRRLRRRRRRRGRQPARARPRPVSRRRRLRLGMVGGGQGALIGAVHRLAARMDDRYELVAGCFSSTAERSRGLGGRARRGAGAGLWRLRRDGASGSASGPTAIDVVAIVTPNHLHLPAARGVPGRRLPRHLRQAADHDRGRGGGAGAAGGGGRAGVRADAQLHRLPDGARGQGDGGGGRSWAGCGWSRSSTRRTGWRRRSSSRARSRPSGAPIRRARARAARWPTSARTPTTSPASSPAWSCARWRPT